MPAIRYTTIGVIVLAFVVAAVAVRIAHVVVHRLLGALEIVGSENRTAVQARAQQLIRALTFLAYGVAALASISLAFERLGYSEAAWHPRDLLHWAVTHGINVAIILVGAFIVVRAANLAIEHLQFKLARRHATTDLEWQRRAATLSGILTSLVTVTVVFVGILMVMRELTIDVVPILTGAGIAGLAIGFGAQNLVRDVISGFFLILEDQVRVGDIARINGVAGSVEQVNLRTIVLRDGEGAVHAVPKGRITARGDLSKQFAYALVDVQVAYSENLHRVIGTMREVGASLEKDPSWSTVVLAPIEISGVESLEGGAASVRARLKIIPLPQGR